MLPSYLYDSIVLLTAAVIFVPLLQYLRLGPILGYLVAGIAIGPWALGLIDEIEQIRHIAELGIAFLLFIVGVELKPQRLLVMRKWVFGLGSAQVFCSGAVLMALLIALGFAPMQALIIGSALALSSTAFVLQLLKEQGLLNSTPGRRAFAILLLQDLAVVPLLVLLPLFSRGVVPGVQLLLALLQACALLALIIIGGRFFLRPILHQIARTGNADIFAASAVLLVLGVAALVSAAGFSIAMGAFIAGLLIADSEYRHQVLADIQPFRSFLLGLFFISVGMSMDLSLLGQYPQQFVLALCALLLLKGLIIWLLARLLGVSRAHANMLAMLLAQSGEFALVVFAIAFKEGLLAPALFDQLVLLVALSMALTPSLAAAARRYGDHGEHAPQAQLIENAEPAPHQVIIAGFGRVGRRVAEMLEAFDIAYIAIDADAALVRHYRAQGCPVYFGNAASPGTLNCAGVANTQLVVVTIDQHSTSQQLVAALRQQFPALHIVSRGRDNAHCRLLRQAGADETVSEAFEASLQLGVEALQRLGKPYDQVFWIKQQLRTERAAAMQATSANETDMRDDD